MRKSIPILIIWSLMSITTALAAQPEILTFHLDGMLKMTSEAQSSYKLELIKVAGDSFDGIIYDYMGKIKAKGGYVQKGKKFIEDGHFLFFFQNGLIESEGDYDLGVKVGSWKRFDNNGKRKSDRYYPAESADKIRETMHIGAEEDEK